MDEGQNEGNNSAFRAIPITVPDVDLQVTSVSSPDAALSGQVITVSWMVRNTGTIGTFAPQWTDSVFLSRDQILDTTDRTIGFKAHNGALAAGASYTETLDVTVPGGLTGPYDVLVAADVRNQIYETDESNNSGVALSAVTLELPAPADLKVTLVEPPASGSPGEEATIRWTVLNQGPNVATGNWTDAIYLSKDQVWDIDDALVS